MTHHVIVKQIEERKQTALVVFEMDKKVWKRVPFQEISKIGEGALRPLWKPEPMMTTVPQRPADFEKKEDDEEEEAVVQGPEGPPKADEEADEDEGVEA